jgi:hypothetical protein
VPLARLSVAARAHDRPILCRALCAAVTLDRVHWPERGFLAAGPSSYPLRRSRTDRMVQRRPPGRSPRVCNRLS